MGARWCVVSWAEVISLGLCHCWCWWEGLDGELAGLNASRVALEIRMIEVSLLVLVLLG